MKKLILAITGILFILLPTCLNLTIYPSLLLYLIGVQCLHYLLVARKDYLFDIFHRNIDKANALHMSTEELYEKSMTKFNNTPSTERYLYAYSVSRSKISNYLFVGFIAMLLTLTRIDFPVTPSYLDTPALTHCPNQKSLDTALAIARPLLGENVNYYLYEGLSCPNCNTLKDSETNLVIFFYNDDYTNGATMTLDTKGNLLNIETY